VVCDASEGGETNLLNHKLSFSKELEGEAFEQVALDVLACEAQVAQFNSSEITRDAKRELRWES